MQKYAFLDRDGTLLVEPEQQEGENYPKITTKEEMTKLLFLDGAIEGMTSLIDKGYKLIMVSNQPYLGTPRRPKDIYEEVTKNMNTELAKNGISFDFVMMCPH